MASRFTQGLGRTSEKILLDLRERIHGGEFQPGDKLPKEVELCEEYGASRSTVRRAVARLVDEGLVRVRKRAGMFVCEPPSNTSPANSRSIAVMSLFNDERLQRAQTQAVNEGCLLTYYFQFERHFDAATERAFFETILTEKYRALLAICTPLSTTNDDLLEQLTQQGTRVIHLEPYTDGLPGQEFLLPDYRAAGQAAAVQGLLKGYEHFRFAGFRRDGPWARLQLAGFASTLAEHDQEFNDTQDFYQFPMMGHQPDARERLRKFAGSLPENTQVHCRSANLGHLLLRELQELGRSVPEDIGITSSDSGPVAEECHVDILMYDFEAILMRALGIALRNPAEHLRELVPPTYEALGTLRKTAR